MGREHLKEYYNAPENVISFRKRIADSLELRYTFNKGVETNHYHVGVTRAQLTRHLPKLMPTIIDELESGFNDVLGHIGSGMASSPYNLQQIGLQLFRTKNWQI